MVFSTYSEIRNYRHQEMKKVSHNHLELNHLHDQIMLEVVKTAILRMEIQLGPCPSPFTFFVMGSAGRFEQAIWSDQDHGIIYIEENDQAKQYFLKIGKEIGDGLFETGYEYCDGDVMASNPLWCQSLPEWQRQLKNWMVESSWESIRHLLIFIDGRSLYGESTFVNELKMMVFDFIQKEHLLPRILNNTLHIKKGLGVLGQFLVETHGSHTGSLNLKEKVLFPYVNAIRFLSIKENSLETSTINRLQKLSEKSISCSERKLIEQYFLRILHLRLSYGDHTNYESGHFLMVDKLTPFEKKELKDIMKYGTHFFQSNRKFVIQDEYE